MKYYIDTEFNEGFHKAFMKPNRHFIDLISIGISSEDDREYYAISKEFDVYTAFNKHEVKVNFDFKPQQEESEYNPMYTKEYWLRDNVLKPIYWELIKMEEPILCHAEYAFNFTYNNFKRLIKKYGKTNKQIAEEIEQFVGKCSLTSVDTDRKLTDNGIQLIEEPEFYAYYADYDWVVFCSLFGTMMNLPKGFPMYCRDLKQTLDEVIENRYNNLKLHPKYPSQSNEHNALDDAKWNKALHKFLQEI